MNSDTSNNGSSSSTGFGGFGGDGPSPTTAVAMIILYSITGIITALFVIIILTGAVRAHRHPERYGPRAGAAGRAGQSRAKGIARAMLATLPIVKFGDQEPAAVKPPTADSDIEMNAATLPRSAGTEATPELQPNMGGVVPVLETEKDKDSASQSSGKADGAGAGLVNNADGTQDDGSLGCSICTEDFTRGEEVRVLPCNHKFHPACVDPWLLNVSGTCPLCRIDLRGKSTEETADGEAPLSPPLETDRQASADFGPARNASIPSLIHMRNAGSREERIAALRRLRNATRNSSTSEVAGVGAEQRQTVTSRLRDRFRIRTTRAREPSVAEERPLAERRPSAAAISSLPTTGAATPAAAELRPLREVYRIGRRDRDRNEPGPLIG